MYYSKIWTLFIFILTLFLPAQLKAENWSDINKLQQAVNSLSTYKLDGTSIETLRNLKALQKSSVQRVEVTAQFLSSAVAADLLIYSKITNNTELKQNLASFFETRPEKLHKVINRELQKMGNGVLGTEAHSYSEVIKCLRTKITSYSSNNCENRLEEIAESNQAGSTAASLILLEKFASTAEQSRFEPTQALSLLLQQTHRVCSNTKNALIQQQCLEAQNIDDEIGYHIILTQILNNYGRQFAELMATRANSGDPLAKLASPWTTKNLDRLGWSIQPQPLNSSSFPHINLPNSSKSAGLLPLELLVIGEKKVSVAITPYTISSTNGTTYQKTKLLSPPGKTIFRKRGSLLPVLRPVPNVTVGLKLLRSTIDQEIEALGEMGPTWVSRDQPVLGLILDEQVTLIEIARYIESAREAGYQKFALIGCRSDGHLTVLPTEMGTLKARQLSHELLRVRISPRELNISHAGATREMPRGDTNNIGMFVKAKLDNSGPVSFEASANPAMNYRMIFPTLDSIMAAAPPLSPPLLFLLPP